MLCICCWFGWVSHCLIAAKRVFVLNTLCCAYLFVWLGSSMLDCSQTFMSTLCLCIPVTLAQLFVQPTHMASGCGLGWVFQFYLEYRKGEGGECVTWTLWRSWAYHPLERPGRLCVAGLPFSVNHTLGWAQLPSVWIWAEHVVLNGMDLARRTGVFSMFMRPFSKRCLFQ